MKNRKLILGWVICLLMCVVAGCDKEDAPVEEVANQGSEYEYRPFVVEGKRWEVVSYRYDGLRYKSINYISGDTVINNLQCKKLYEQSLSPTEYTAYLGGLYENNKKVFAVSERGMKVLYDFNLNVGDKVFYGNNHVSITDIDYVITDTGKRFRRIHVHVDWIDEFGIPDKPASGEFIWIEGVGSSYGPELSYEIHNHAEVLNCYENDTCIFTYDDFFH